MKKYDNTSIKVLEGLDAVRARPGMYIGSTGSKGLHHLVWEVVDNAIDEALAGHANDIKVTLYPDNSIEVLDNGRGIPVEMHETGVPTTVVVLTKLHAGGKFNNDSYKFSGGLHGVGISVVNALSTKVEVTVYRDNKAHEFLFEKGDYKTYEVKSEKHPTGTKVRFYPDSTIFSTTNYNHNTLNERLKELAYLNKNIKITFNNLRDNINNVYKFDRGIIDYLDNISGGKYVMNPISSHDSVVINGKPAEVEVALAYVNNYNTVELSFVNNIKTIDGGTHVSGFRTGLTKIINEIAKDKNTLKAKDGNFQGNDIREGLCAIINIKLSEPQFESQTKDKLGSIEATALLTNFMSGKMKDIMKDNKQIGLVIEKIKLAVEARLKASAVKELVRNKTTGVLSNPPKLASCISKKPEECEIFLVEG